jgi:hypothetical protein
MLEVLNDNNSIHMGITCAPLLVDLFLYSHVAEFMEGLSKKNERS